MNVMGQFLQNEPFMHKKALVIIIAALIGGCSSIDPFETSHRESSSYGEMTETQPTPLAPIPADPNSINNDTMIHDQYAPPITEDYTSVQGDSSTQDQTLIGQYDMGGVSEDGQSYYPAGAVQQDATTITPAPLTTASADLGAASLAQAEASEKQEEWGSMIMLLEQAASEGSAKANYLLAKHYTKGDVIPKDQARADAYLELADNMGYSEATRVMAWNLLLDNQLDKGKQVMERAALTSVRAQRDLGLLYLGTYKPDLNDPGSGQQYLEKAYANGDAEAAYQLAKQLGDSTEKGSEALQFAAQHGHPKALLIQGNNAMKSGNPMLAREKYESSALGGNADAMYQLANAINIGKISSSDKETEAYIWFSLAQNAGNNLAQEELKALAGVKQMNNKKHPGSLDEQIKAKQGSIVRWNPNAD
jgi:TPR repeat protein